MPDEQQTDLYYKLGEMHGDIKATLAEAKRTNGRVTKLEQETIPALDKRMDRIDQRIAYYLGGVAVLLVIIQLLAPKIIDRLL